MNKLQEWAKRHKVSDYAMADLTVLFSGTETSVADTGSESGVQGRIRAEAPKRGATLWRNNVGAALDEDGRPIRYGLANDSKKLNDVFKSSDLIGITPKLISLADLGSKVGVFTAVEVKAPGWRGPSSQHEQAQHAFLTTVQAFGGIGTFASSVEDYIRCV